MSVPTPSRGAAGGGVPARRALIRWSWRMLRRKWRSQALVTALLAVALIAAVAGGTAAHNTPRPQDPKLGAADTSLPLDGGDPQAMAADLAALRAAAGTVETIGHSQTNVPGSATPIDLRSQRPHGVFAGSLLDLRQGRYPSGAGEATITAGVARQVGLRLGGTIAIEGKPRTIVGIVENPSDLNDEFILVDPASVRPQLLTVLIRGTPELPRLRTVGTGNDRGGDDTKGLAATLALAAATILLLLVAFVAAAGFAVLARRRLRRLGILAAIGATGRQVRLVMAATGMLVGLVASVLGTLAGLALWPVIAGPLETAVGHRIEVSNIPWTLIATLMLLAIVMSTAAAWWPARTVSRVPVTHALSGRPPAPRAGHRGALLAIALFVTGSALLAWDEDNPLSIVGGTIATALGILFAAPPAIKLLAAAGSRAPIAVRLALRDLARHRGRSGAAVAAVSVALGIPTAIVIIATSVQATPATGNLSDQQLLIKIGRPEPPDPIPVRTAAELGSLATQVNRIAGGLSRASVIPLDKPYDPAEKREAGQDGRPAQPTQTATASLGHGDSGSLSIPTYVATPELYSLLRIDPAKIGPSTEVVTRQSYRLMLPNGKTGRTDDVPATTRVHTSAYTALPSTLITPGALTRRHWSSIRCGWLVVSDQPLTERQKTMARTVAAAAGLTVETRDSQAGIGSTRVGATAVGIIFALGILAMTVGLIRSEAAPDLRTLTATGASRSIRRTLTAATAGALALLGVVLGVAGSCLGLMAVFRDDLSVFGRVPPGYPLTAVLGMPLIATVAGWLLAGREPPTIARRLGE